MTGFVQRDLDDPRAELALAAELRKVLEGLEERFLRHIFGLLLTLQHSNRHGVNQLLIWTDQFHEEFPFAGQNPFNQDEFAFERFRSGGVGAMRNIRTGSANWGNTDGV